MIRIIVDVEEKLAGTVIKMLEKICYCYIVNIKEKDKYPVWMSQEIVDIIKNYMENKE